MLESEIAFAGVAGQSELLQRGDVSSRELVELALARIEASTGAEAFGAVYAERAREEADRGRPAQSGGRAHAAAGRAGRRQGRDRHRRRGDEPGNGRVTARAAADAEVVRRLRTAGAVVVGKTTMPELGLWPFTESMTWGVTRNPWDVERTPGGSSGGSAAAVAAGMVPVALGADGAGSIRIPAACTGLFGLKPQSGRVPRAPHDRDGSHWITSDTLTRSVLDTAIVLDALVDRCRAAMRRGSRTRRGRSRVAADRRLLRVPGGCPRPPDARGARRAGEHGGPPARAGAHGRRAGSRLPPARRPRDPRPAVPRHP